MDRSALAQRIRDISQLSGTFRLRSGQTSSFYFDKYRFESQPGLLAAVAGELQSLLPTTYDRIAGLELGGIPLVTILGLQTGKPMLFRKHAKEYGTGNLVEGGFSRGDRVVVEDVVTTAGQVCRSVQQMREVGLQVSHVICVIGRQQGGSENLAQIGCSLARVFTRSELEPHAS